MKLYLMLSLLSCFSMQAMTRSFATLWHAAIKEADAQKIAEYLKRKPTSRIVEKSIEKIKQTKEQLSKQPSLESTQRWSNLYFIQKCLEKYLENHTSPIVKKRMSHEVLANPIKQKEVLNQIGAISNDDPDGFSKINVLIDSLYK